MMFNDDEHIAATNDISGTRPKPLIAGKVKLTDIHKQEAPLVETDFKVMLELKGVGSGKQRSGVDLVMVLDVSASMGSDNKLEKMKAATKFVIRKLSSVDRLSVVTFSDGSSRLCPLRQMTEATQVEIGNLVDSLVAGGGTNIAGGLKTGLQVIHERQITNGRAFAVMLMSDGEQNLGDGTPVKPDDVPVYTFGFGTEQSPELLKTIADNSKGGVFSDVRNIDNLSIAFSQCLAGLLTIYVQDLKLVITELDSAPINKVAAGNYPQSKVDATGSVTVSFGDLCHGEVRKIIVELLLPAAAHIPVGSEVVEVNYTYRTMGMLFEAPPKRVYINRIKESYETERVEVKIEENRVETARNMKDARIMADERKLDDAVNKINETQNKLKNLLAYASINPQIEMLDVELQQLKNYMETQETYKQKGHPFALSSETSHDRQRLTVRGDDVDKIRLFSTPRMDTYLEQVKSFTRDPSKPLPTVKQDIEEEIKNNPLVTFAGPLSFYLDGAIQSLKSIQVVVENGTLI